MSSRSSGLDQARKRARTSKSGDRAEAKRLHRQSGAEPDEEIRILEEQVLDSRKHYNNITILLEQARGEDVARSSEAQTALCRVFCHLLASGALQGESSSADNDAIVERWLVDRLNDVWMVVVNRISEATSEDQKLRLRLLMQVLKEEAVSSSTPMSTLLKKRAAGIFKCLANDSSQDQLRDFFLTQFAAKYIDLAFAALSGLQQVLAENPLMTSVDASINILDSIGQAQPKMYWTRDQKRAAGQGDVTQKSLIKAGGEGWLIVMNQPLSKTQRKTLLRLIPKRIAPTLKRTEKLLDFLVDSFNEGGSTALLALSGLFNLIQEKNLDYPDFYRKVYSMLDPAILHSKHRSSFLRLLDTFLASTHLPAALVASFIKRLARLCLFAPPAAIAYIVPLTYNLLKAHPACTFMIHRELSKGSDTAETDPFDMVEKDPVLTGALDSSLWELHTLESHYHPNVAIIARIISEEFTKPAFNLEDFLDHSYASMLEADLVKPIKREPAIEYQIPKVIFPRRTREQPTTYENVLELWVFDG